MIKLGIERLFIQGRVWLKQAYFKIEEIEATTFTSEPGTQPTTPAENEIYLYAKESASSDVSRLWFKDDAGVEHELPSASAVGPSNADYLVKTANASLSAERVVTDTTSIVWDWATAAQAKATRAALTGDVTASANSNATTIANDAVTNAKMANAAAWTYKVRNDSSSGDLSDAAVGDITTATPVAGDFVVGFLDTGEIRKFDVDDLGGSSSSGTDFLVVQVFS